MTNPEELLLGIYARVFLYPRHSLVKAHASFDMGKQLFEAHRVESVEMSLGLEPFGFVKRSVSHHAFSPRIDACKQLRSVGLQIAHLDLKRPFGSYPAAH